MKSIARILPRQWRPVQAGVAGLLATVVYSVVMEGDKSLSGSRFSDALFIEGLVNRNFTTGKQFPLLGWILHFVNGILLGEAYAAFFTRVLPGPGWLRGTIFGEIFIVSAWWLTPLADKYHPLIKSGELPKLASWSSFLQNIVRHLAFGLALGLLYRDNEKRSATRP